MLNIKFVVIRVCVMLLILSIFFALTAIEVFSLRFISGYVTTKISFTDLLDNVYVLDKDQIQKDKIRCDEILSRNKRVTRNVLLELLLRLFPRLRHLYQPTLSFLPFRLSCKKMRRICSPDYLKLFRLSMQSGQNS